MNRRLQRGAQAASSAKKAEILASVDVRRKKAAYKKAKLQVAKMQEAAQRAKIAWGKAAQSVQGAKTKKKKKLAHVAARETRSKMKKKSYAESKVKLNNVGVYYNMERSIKKEGRAKIHQKELGTKVKRTTRGVKRTTRGIKQCRS